MQKYCIVITTFESETQAQPVIDTVLENKLAACVQVLNIGSQYTWNGELCHDKETLVLFKTLWKHYDALEEKIIEMHPYETPEVVALNIENGYKGYLDWLVDETK